jgi:stage V sporulation protein SpoVS
LAGIVLKVRGKSSPETLAVAQRFADGLQRLEVELNADGDLLVNQALGYSP